MKYYISLFQKIKEIYKTQSSNELEIPLICPSSRVFDVNELKLLLPQMMVNNESKMEAMIKKQDMSYQLNSLPSTDAFWDFNPSNTLFEVYEKILNKSKISDDNLLNEVDNKKAEDTLYSNKKQTKEYKQYLKYIAKIEKFFIEWEDHVSTYSDLNNEEEKKLWTEKLNNIFIKKDKLSAELKVLGFKDLIENALETINKKDEFDMFLESINNQKTIVETSKQTGLVSHASFNDINFIPYDFMTSDNGWTSVSLEKEELDLLLKQAMEETNNMPKEILDFDYDEDYILGVEFEYTIVTMIRNWFSLSPLTSKYFTWKESKPISNGENINNDFLLPAFPKKMILMKNLKINLDPSLKKENVDQLNQIINFGPILMKGQLFNDQKKNVHFIKAIKNKEVLQSRNVEYLKTKSAQENEKKVLIDRKITTAPNVINRPIRHNRSRVANNQNQLNPAIQTDKPYIVSSHFGRNLVKHINLFNQIKDIPVNINLTKVIFNIIDKESNTGVYKSEISLIGTNNNYFKEIESDQEGKISCDLPLGNYKIKIFKNGYDIYEEELKIINKNTIDKSIKLNPNSVYYDSYFLIGMICEKLPKI